MTQDHVIEILSRMMILSLSIAAPILGIGMLVGLIVAVFQAATQVNESSLSFVPKLLALGATLIFLGPWALTQLIDFMTVMLNDLVFLGGGGV